MNHPVKIKSALVSVYYKDKLEPLVQFLKAQGVQFYSTGGTQTFLEEQGASVTAVENLTDYPAIFGGRVKRCTRKYLEVFCTAATTNRIKAK